MITWPSTNYDLQVLVPSPPSSLSTHPFTNRSTNNPLTKNLLSNNNALITNNNLYSTWPSTTDKLRLTGTIEGIQGAVESVCRVLNGGSMHGSGMNNNNNNNHNHNLSPRGQGQSHGHGGQSSNNYGMGRPAGVVVGLGADGTAGILEPPHILPDGRSPSPCFLIYQPTNSPSICTVTPNPPPPVPLYTVCSKHAPANRNHLITNPLLSTLLIYTLTPTPSLYICSQACTSKPQTPLSPTRQPS